MSKQFDFKNAQILKILKIEAEKVYINMVNDLLKAEKTTDNNESNSINNTVDEKKFQDIAVSVEYGNVYKITLNRPAKYNAITVKVCIN